MVCFAAAGCSVPGVAVCAVVLAAGASVEVVEVSVWSDDAAASPAVVEDLAAEVVFGAAGFAVGRVNAMAGVVAASSVCAPCPVVASPVFAGVPAFSSVAAVLLAASVATAAGVVAASLTALLAAISAAAIVSGRVASPAGVTVADGAAGACTSVATTAREIIAATA